MSVWVQGTNKKWFNGYWGQKIAILDEFRCYDEKDLVWLLQIIGEHDIMVEKKGGYVHWRPEIIIITSPKHPEIECEGFGESVNQVMRRCDKIVEFDKVWKK